MIRLLKFTFAVAAAGVLIGCSSDRCAVIDHPSEVQADSTFDVVLTNFFVNGSPSATVMTAANRDSIHIAAGVPSGWDVLSASYCVDTSFNIATVLRSSTPDTAALYTQLATYLTSITPMTPDAPLQDAMTGRTIKSHDNTNKTTVSVNTSNIDKWVGFSAPVNIVLAAGTKQDTTMPKADLLKILGANGVDTAALKTSQPLLTYITTVGFTVIPVVITLKVKASADAVNDTLYYYSKSAQMLSASSTETIDIGDMVYVPVSIVAAAVKRSAIRTIGQNVVLSKNSSGIAVQFTNSSPSQSVAIYNMNGTLVERIGAVNGTAQWNASGRFAAGTYVARIANGKQVATEQISITR